MNIIFENFNPIYQNGIYDFLKLHNISIAKGGLMVTVSVNPDVNIRITKNNTNVVFEVDREYQIFRCITLLKERAEEESFVIEEKRYFDT